MDLTGFGSIADLLKTAVDKIWPDPAQKAQAQIAILQAEQAGQFKQMDNDFNLAIEQIKTNAVEAAQPGFHFRDGAGWIATIAFGLMVLRVPIEWVTALCGHPLTLPPMDPNASNDILYGLLGLGGMHVYQTVKGA